MSWHAECHTTWQQKVCLHIQWHSAGALFSRCPSRVCYRQCLSLPCYTLMDKKSPQRLTWTERKIPAINNASKCHWSSGIWFCQFLKSHTEMEFHLQSSIVSYLVWHTEVKCWQPTHMGWVMSWHLFSIRESGEKHLGSPCRFHMCLILTFPELIRENEWERWGWRAGEGGIMWTGWPYSKSVCTTRLFVIIYMFPQQRSYFIYFQHLENYLNSLKSIL